MIVERVEHPHWLSNAFLVADRPDGHGVLVDSNGLGATLERQIAADRITITHVLCTHGHADHVVDIDQLADAPLLAHPEAGVKLDAPLADGDVISSGELAITAIYTPGHCRDHFSLLFNGSDVLTGDVLFKGTVGGTAAPDGDLDELKRSILDVLLALDPATVVHPGHGPPTTIGAERETNPFVRAWLRGEGLGEEPCLVNGEPATLLLWAPDYDGGYKALVRLGSGVETIVGGSRVTRTSSG